MNPQYSTHNLEILIGETGFRVTLSGFNSKDGWVLLDVPIEPAILTIDDAVERARKMWNDYMARIAEENSEQP